MQTEKILRFCLAGGFFLFVIGLYLLILFKPEPTDNSVQNLLAAAIFRNIIIGTGEFYCVSGIAIISGFFLLYPFPRPDHKRLVDRIGFERVASFTFLLAGIYCLGYSAFNYNSLTTMAKFWLDYSLIGVAICFILSILAFPFNSESTFSRFIIPFFSDLINGEGSTPRKQNIAIFGVLFVSVSFLLLELALSGSIQHNSDETLYLTAGKQMLQGTKCSVTDNLSGVQFGFQEGYLNPNAIHSTCNFEHPFFAKLLLGVFGPRVSLFLATLSIPLVSYITWGLTHGNARATILASIFMALDPMSFGLAGLALLDSISIFFTIAAFAVLVCRKFPRNLRMMLAGIMMALSILSKETAILVLPALVLAPFLISKDQPLKDATTVAISTIIFTVLGLQLFASLFTTFPTFVSQIIYIAQYGAGADIIRADAIQFPYITLVSVFPMDYGRDIILDIVTGASFFCWLPIAIYRIFFKKGQVRLFEVSFLWLIFPYVALSILWFLGRTIIAYYAVQFVSPLAIGAAYFLSGERIPIWLAVLAVLGSAAWFVIFVFNPTHIQFEYNSPVVSQG